MLNFGFNRRQKDIERQAVLTDDISLGNNSDFYNISSNDPKIERISEPNYGTGNKDILSLHNSNYDGGQSESWLIIYLFLVKFTTDLFLRKEVNFILCFSCLKIRSRS